MTADVPELPFNEGIYFIREGDHGPIKIGRSNDAKKRLASLQTGNSTPLELLAVMPGDESIERQLHEDFAAWRINGEWFEPNPDLSNLIFTIHLCTL